MRRNRSTKILATLGPASSTPERIEALFQAGADVFRLNFSHGDHEDHRARLATIRDIEQRLGRPIGVLADLQGPKIRIGKVTDGTVHLSEGAAFRLDMESDLGDENRAPLPHPEVFAALEAGMDLLIDDGRIRLRVDEAGSDFARCTVIVGGELKDRKGVNLPQAILPVGAMTDKDRKDLNFALEIGVDWVALSFVQRPDDIAEARRLIAGRAAVMAKIEKPAALGSIDEIIELADAVMVARGDLGVELPVEDVPALQKNLVRLARRAGKPVVVATQMLESMVEAPVPTRAEVSDVATAVYDGADAIMLSAETASGGFPVEAVKVMDRVAQKVEHDPGYRAIMDTDHAMPEATASDAITAAARQVAETISAEAIVTYTTSGSTALRAARERPLAPIMVLTPSLITARRLAVVWGLHCVHGPDARSFTDMVDRACRIAVEEGLARVSDRLVITAGVPFGTPGATNTLRIAWIGNT
jgi:pyruvate kinase